MFNVLLCGSKQFCQGFFNVNSAWCFRSVFSSHEQTVLNIASLELIRWNWHTNETRFVRLIQVRLVTLKPLWSHFRWCVGGWQRWVPRPSFHDGGASAGAGRRDHAAEIFTGWCSAQDPPPRSASTITETATHCRWVNFNSPMVQWMVLPLPSVFTLDSYLERDSHVHHIVL